MSEVAATDLLDQTFQRVLGRPLRAGEADQWASLLEAQGVDAVIGALLDSDEHRTAVAPMRFVPPGHFYSPIPSDAEIAEHAGFNWNRTALPGIDLNQAGQLELLKEFARGYSDLPFGEEPREGLRYHYGNPNYSYSDATFLVSMVRHLKPKRFIEVGSGDSSCALLDARDHFLGGQLDVTFIEPYPQYLKELLGSESRDMRILEQRLQDVDLAEFESLEAGDVLFIDSTHVSKVGSDVNHLIFEILPRLASGVHVHIHDIFWPFEYPNDWLVQGRAWNENYILRAFLEFNANYEIALFGHWAVTTHSEWFAEHMPNCLKNAGGSIWLRRV
jgi:Methyltransferase domain